MLSCLVRQHKYELFHALFYSPLSIAPVYHTMSILSITFLVYQPFELESVMAVSKGVTTRSSEKIVLLVDADRTTVVLAQEPAPPHITHTHADCTPTSWTEHRLHHRAPKHEQLVREPQCPKHEDHHSESQLNA